MGKAFRGLGSWALGVGISRNNDRKMHEQSLGDVGSEGPPLGQSESEMLGGHMNGDFQWIV